MFQKSSAENDFLNISLMTDTKSLLVFVLFLLKKIENHSEIRFMVLIVTIQWLYL